jgi:hypothetical protein
MLAMPQLTDADLSTTETIESSNENTMKKSDDHEVQQTFPFPDGAAVAEVNIDTGLLVLLCAAWLLVLQELLESTQKASSIDSSTVTVASTEASDNRNKISPKCGLYEINEDRYRERCELTVEQWERLRAVLCTESSLDFPIPGGVVELLLRYKKSGDCSAWFENLIMDINSLAIFVEEGSQADPVANFPPIRTIVDVPSSAEVCEQRNLEHTIYLNV